MKPYYEHAGITIYHGDCREILPQLLKCDLLLTDPPYGVGFIHGVGGGNLARSTAFAGQAVIGDDEPFEPEWLFDLAEDFCLWGANHYATHLPNRSCWLIWDKREGMCQNDQADCEIAWTSLDSPARLFRHYWNGMLKASEAGTPRVHPTQKPIALMKWCLSMFPDSVRIADPYCGSGGTLIAAKAMGLTASGIEIDERYCEIAAKRLSQEVFDFSEAK